ncbi:sigma-54-dependent transcriptional regulator [candidate division KSB1 bacterium]
MTKSSNKETLLVVDDAPDTLEVLQRNLSSKGFKVFSSLNVSDAIKILDGTKIDLVITDYKMPKVNGFDLVRHVKENFRDTEVMMITGYATIEGAVTAVKTGASEYLAKPFTDEELFTAVKKVITKLRKKRTVKSEWISKQLTNYGLIGESKIMHAIHKATAKAASISATVLITGESGTGKEIIARAIHYNSPRSSAPFVPINCGGIPENLLESELFGYVKGAFTGAAESRAGFFQTADGGTIFLDEISETSPSMQVKLLRVLQDKEVYMIGSSRPKKVDIRIIAATNKDLQSLIKKKGFREDLFFRLNVITIDIPPLRERGNDILLLIRYFAKKFSDEIRKKPINFTDDVLNALLNYNWPGNVRELENIIQRLTVMLENESVDVPDLPPHMRFSLIPSKDFNKTLAEIEAEYIRNVLDSVKGNKTKAAKILNIDRKTLREKLARMFHA